MNLVRCRFEVVGKVQGVFFRKCTYEAAVSKGLNGFVQNSSIGSVIGELEGEETKVNSMIDWLTKIGSPASRIDRFILHSKESITSQDAKYTSFELNRIRKDAFAPQGNNPH